MLAFANLFCWVYEPRQRLRIPFLTWPYQDECFQILEQNLGQRDIVFEKSRDVGITFICLVKMLHDLIYMPDSTMGVVSETKEKVDNTGDPDSLFWKLEYNLRRLPDWLFPDGKSAIKRQKLAMINSANGSTIMGYACTDDLARGGRKSAFFMDEIAFWSANRGYEAWSSTQFVTNSRIAGSTANGRDGIFFDLVNNQRLSIVRHTVHWSMHPLKARGMYMWHRDQPEPKRFDSYKFPKKYPFEKDGKLRSPYYDTEVNRHPLPAKVARELDLDYDDSAFPFFDRFVIEDHKNLYARPPRMRYMFDIQPTTQDFTLHEHDQGELLVWCELPGMAPTLTTDYVIGCDICTGKGGSMSTNSVAAVYRTDTSEKVAQWCKSTITPDEFAIVVNGLRRFFIGINGPAYLIWEDNGPGGIFGKKSYELAPARIYYRELVGTVMKRKTNHGGWWSNDKTKRLLLAEYAMALKIGKIVNRDAFALDECRHYVYGTNGMIYHDRSKQENDPSAAGENHGDRVIADALCCRVLLHENLQPTQYLKDNPPRFSIAWREKMRQEEEERRQEDTLELV